MSDTVPRHACNTCDQKPQPCQDKLKKYEIKIKKLLQCKNQTQHDVRSFSLSHIDNDMIYELLVPAHSH
jgi:hypothetical protein